jgi:hypothetical protein
MRDFLTALAFLLFIGLKVSAQSETEDRVIMQNIFGKEKRALIAERIRLSVEEQQAFWQLYDAYEREIMVISAVRLKLIGQYSSEGKLYTDQSDVDVTKSYLDNMEGYNRLDKAYLKKFKKLIGGVRAAIVIQLEIYIQTAIQANLLQQIPLIGNMFE